MTPVFVTAVCEAPVFEAPVFFEAADLVPAFFLVLARFSVVFSVVFSLADGFPALLGLSAAVPEPP
ncbi:hypothetical protein [Streptomyces sporangiiformans]|uniref:hypothetical protein n=1 Tax=Streptomyces sporangiiformans TaxID=2315329 RepID=UPI0030B878DF